MMDQANAVREGEALDWLQLDEYLRSALPELAGELVVEQFHGGHANLTYLLRYGVQEFVLRRPPFGKIAPGAHDMKREFRVLSKLYKVFPAAPRAFHYCGDEKVIGAPFVVMERRRGVVVRYAVPPVFASFENVEQRLTVAMVKAAADLHTVDVAAADLAALGRPEGFAERQLEGWAKRWNFVKTEENKDMDWVLRALQTAVPEPQTVSIIHNDIKFDNCQFQPEDPDRVTSIFDWDMTTLGDPLIDVGSTLGYWQDERLDPKNLPVLLKGNFPDKDFIKNKYGEFTGFSLDRMAWYEGFAYWKAAIILQQLYYRYRQGHSKDSRMAQLGKGAMAFGAMARQVLAMEK